MLMAMVNVRHVRVAMCYRLVAMRVDMRFFAVPGKIVLVLVMLIMRMFMRMRHQYMGMHVGVFFR